MAFQRKKRFGQRKRRPGFKDNSRCRFCRDKVERIDYKDLPVLTKLVTSRGKLFSRKRSGNCRKHQRQAIIALKRSRFLALMAFVQ